MESEIKKLRESRKKWGYVIPASIIFGLIWSFSQASCGNASGERLGCTLEGFFFGTMIVVIGVIVSIIEMVLISRRLRMIESGGVAFSQRRRSKDIWISVLFLMFTIVTLLIAIDEKNDPLSWVMVGVFLLITVRTAYMWLKR